MQNFSPALSRLFGKDSTETLSGKYRLGDQRSRSQGKEKDRGLNSQDINIYFLFFKYCTCTPKCAEVSSVQRPSNSSSQKGRSQVYWTVCCALQILLHNEKIYFPSCWECLQLKRVTLPMIMYCLWGQHAYNDCPKLFWFPISCMSGPNPTQDNYKRSSHLGGLFMTISEPKVFCSILLSFQYRC